MDYSHLLPFCKNEQQKQLIETLTTQGGATKAAKELGINKSNVNRRLLVIKKQAAAVGHAPEAQLSHPVAAGYELKGYSHFTKTAEGESIWLKANQSSENREQHFLAFIAGLNEYIKPAKPRKAQLKKYHQDMANAIIMGDAHIGMIAHALETLDEDYTLTTATRDLCDAFDYLVDSAAPCEEGWFVNVGDFTHVDNTANTTTSGTKQDVAARHFEVMEAAGKVMRYGIDKMLTKFNKVTVINARGNHDNDTAFALNMYIQGVYENEPRVTVQGNRSKFNFIEFGKCLIGVNHGDKINTNRLVGTMSKYMAEAWGKAVFRRWWIGHIHHKTKQETDFGCSVESFNTLVPLESWHSASGYGAERRITMITLHKEFGEVFRIEPSIQLIRSINDR